MRIFFSDSFKKELKIFGNSIKLSTFRLGKYTKQVETEVDENENLVETTLPPTFDRLVNHSELSDYFQFNSIWDEKNFVLSTTLDFTIFPDKDYADEWVTDNTVIFYYYSDTNDNILGIAFILTGEINEDNQISSLDLCTFEIVEGKIRKDRNHINFYFPKIVKSNILTSSVSDNTEFLERSSNTPGINVFLAMEGEGLDNDLLTRGSFLKYARNRKSLNNTTPIYLDGNGEKVLSSINYKHYKSITISALNQLGTTNESGVINYYIESDSTVTITGSLVYDLYQVNNGSYTLIKENELEDLTNTIIKQTNEDGSILDENNVTKNYEIDQLNKQIKFSISDISITSFKCSLVFNSELGETRGTTVEILSNQVSFNTYAKWSVDYSTRFYQKDETTGLTHALLLFDDTAGNKGWDPEGESGTSLTGSGTIVIYTDTEVDVEDIKIEQDSHREVFNSYFSIKKKALGYNINNQKYKYEILITTKLDNIGGERWAPLDNSGESRLILNTIYINNLENDSFEDISFYCVQRVVSPLSLHVIDELTGNCGEKINELIFPGEFGVKSLNSFCLVGSVTSRGKNYASWEYVENKDIINVDAKENDVILSSSSNVVINLEDKPGTDSFITFYSRVSPQINTINLESFVFKRLNSSTLSYDPDNWEDMIYCHSDNDCTINVSIREDSRKTENWLVDSKTKYFYNSEISSYRLYLFDRDTSTPQQFNIINTALSQEDLTKFNNGELIFEVKYEDQSLFDSFFSINFTNSISSGKYITAISITPKILEDSEFTKYSWFPKLSSGGIFKPISVTISNLTNEEKFYCIIKPNFSDTLKIYDADSLDEIQSYEFEKNGGNKALYIASAVGVTGEFDYWTIVGKDPEISVNYNNFGYNPTGAQKLITNRDDITTWPTVPEAKTVLNTYSVSPNVLEYFYDSLVIRRATAGYSNLISYYRDWKNQLCEDNELSLSLKQRGQDYSDSMSIYIAGENENLVQLEKGEALELNHIGLYKIYVRSTSMFRIIIDGPNKKDNFYFFDSNTDQYLPDILMKDISSFNAITGREVCFAFLGNEENRFKVKEQTLSTYIRVINLEDETEIVIPLHRKYFEKLNGTELSNPVIDTNININSGSIDNKLFFTSTDYVRELIYTSYLETSSYIKYNRLQTYFPVDSIINLNYDAYTSKVTYTRNRVTHTIRSRGNINSSIKLNFSNTPIYTYTDSYPVPLVGTFNIENPEDFNGEQQKLDIYGLIPKPQVSWYTTESRLEGNSLKLYYTADSSTIIGVNKPGHGAEYILYYQEPNSGEWTIFGKEFTEITSKNGLFKIKRRSSETENVDLYEVVEGSGKEYEGEGDNILGSIKIESYVDRNNFLQDFSGNPIDFSDSTIFTQEYVDSLIPASPIPNPVTLGIVQKDKENSISNLTGDTSVISYLGENRTYLLHLLTNDEAYIEESLEEQKEFINSMIFDNEVGELRVDFKSRLKRHNYSPISLRYIYDNITKKYILYASILDSILNDYSKEEEDTSFYVKTKTDTLRLSQVQEVWPSGIRLNGKLYMGLDNVVDVHVSYDTGFTNFYVAPVTLPTTSNSLDVKSEFSIQSMPIIESQLNFITTIRPNTVQNSSTFGYTVSLNNLPTNESSNLMGPYVISFSDESGINKVQVNVYIEPKDSFIIELYSKLVEVEEVDNVYNYVPSSSKVNSLIFSSSGALREPSTGLYLITDAPESYCDFYISSGSMTMADSSVSMSGIEYYMNESIYGRKIGRCRREGETEDSFDVYYITPSSKVNRFRSYNSTTINYLNYFGHKPYKGRTTIGIYQGDYNYVDLPSYYGACTLSIDGPYVTNLSTQFYESVKPEGTQLYPPLLEPIVGKWADFSKKDDGEYNKYTTTNSHFLANSRLYSTSGYGTSYYHLNNIIWVNYTENSSSPKYKNFFNTYGYFCGFLFNISRYEWKKDTDSSTIKLINSDNIDKYCIHEFSDTGRLKLIDLNGTIDRLIYTDHLEEEAEKRSDGNPYTMTLLKYYSNYEVFTSNTEEAYSNGSGTIGYSQNNTEYKYNYAPGILLDLGKNEFTETNGIYTISGDSKKIAITVSDIAKEGATEGTNTDSVTFYINVSLYNMN